MDDEERQYVAGIIDGDGCVHLNAPSERVPRPAPYVTVSQAYNAGQPPELVYLQSRVSGTIHPRKRAAGNRRSVWGRDGRF